MQAAAYIFVYQHQRGPAAAARGGHPERTYSREEINDHPAGLCRVHILAEFKLFSQSIIRSHADPLSRKTSTPTTPIPTPTQSPREAFRQNYDIHLPCPLPTLTDPHSCRPLPPFPRTTPGSHVSTRMIDPTPSKWRLARSSSSSRLLAYLGMRNFSAIYGSCRSDKMEDCGPR